MQNKNFILAKHRFFMSHTSEDKLLMFNQIGLIPGPHEEEEAFIKRVNYSLDLREFLPEDLKEHLSEESTDPNILTDAAAQLKKQYDCNPTWTPLFFSNYKLPCWNGGCAWIFQMTETSPTSALIQLRQAFSKSANYLKLYHREELLTHELSHVGRMMFQEQKFEELLAYRTATSSYRRWIGPLVQSSAESALFLLLLFMLIVFDVFLLAVDRPDAYSLALWLKVIPIALIGAAFTRLWKRQKTFDACIKNLKSCVASDQAEAVAYRLKDEEIILFSKIAPQDIKDYAVAKSNQELRWEVIFKAYF